MGGAAPGGRRPRRHLGHLPAGTARSLLGPGHAYDNSDSVLELSPSLQPFRVHRSRPRRALNNSQDLDMLDRPGAAAFDGQVVLAGKSRIVYLLSSGADPGRRASASTSRRPWGRTGTTVGTACSDDIGSRRRQRGGNDESTCRAWAGIIVAVQVHEFADARLHPAVGEFGDGRQGPPSAAPRA